ERGLYEARGVDLEWVTVPQGTGAMCDKLEANEVDVAIMLSEGAVARAAAGGPFKVVGTYVQSPLRWGVHTKRGSGISSIADLKGKVFGVSRMLSGSHLMAYVMAHERGWDLSKDAPLKLCGTLDGAREAMGKGEIDAWLWEKFTTKFLVDSGEWDIVGEVPTPWPCFLIVASDRAIESHGREIRAIVEATSPVCKEFKANSGGTTFAYVAKHHALQDEQDAAEWLNGTEWACSLEVNEATLRKTQAALVTIGQLDHTVPFEKLYAASMCKLVA
ncbi:unnamed protein product, partial [Prorocentrum cordatum]